ncbi:MAG TPA: hypothetical protein VIK47_08550 [Kiloniellales bacterium]
MGALKALVVFMGILIAAGLGLLAYAVVGRLPATQSGGFGDAAVTLPPGCTIAAAAIDAGVLVLRADGPAERGCQQVILLDSDTGRELGRVTAREGL